MSIASSLKATGVADVIVVLRPKKGAPIAAADASVPAKVLRHFRSSPFSQDSALLEVLKARGGARAARAASGGTSATSINNNPFVIITELFVLLSFLNNS